MDLLQKDLEQDFRYSDDEVIDSLTVCMEELRRKKLDVPTAPDDELPKKPFGLMYKPTVGHLRRINDNSVLTGRFSQSFSVDDRPVNNRIRPSDRQSISPTSLPPSSPEKRMGDYRYVTNVKVGSPPRAPIRSTVETTEPTTIEYVFPLKTPTIPDERAASVELTSLKDGMHSPTRQERINSPVFTTNGGKTVIRIE